MKKILLIIAFILPFAASAQLSVLRGPQGGTNTGTATAGDIGNCLKVASIGPLVWTIGTCGGGGSGDPYPFKLTGNATSTLTGFNGGIFASASSTFNNFTFNQATGTSATTTSFFSTTASTTNLFGTFINGFGLRTCTGSNFLQWSAGSFGCAAGSAGGSASSTLLTDNNHFTVGTNTIDNFIAGNATDTNATTTNAFNAGKLLSNGWIVSTSTTVCANGCQYKSIQTALNDGWLYVRIKNEVYSEQITVQNSKTTIEGDGDNSIIQCNGITQSPCLTTNAKDEVTLRTLSLRELNATLNGIGIDFSNSSLVRIENNRISNFATSTFAHDSANNTFYDVLSRNTFFNPRSCIDLGGSQANNNHAEYDRCRPMTTGGFGLYLSDVRGFTSVGDDFEATSTTGNTTGVFVDATSREISITNPWIEAHGTGVNIASGANRVIFTSGSITSNGTDLTDNGTNSVFLNTSLTGTLKNSLGAATSSSFAMTGLATPAGAFLAVNPQGSVIATSSPTGGSASSTLYADNGHFTGTNTFDTLVSGTHLATGSTTLQNFTGVNSTTSNATSTTLFATTASTTNLYLGIGSCSGSSALNIVSGRIVCGAITGLTAASSTLLTDNNHFTVGSNTLDTLIAGTLLVTSSSTFQNFTGLNSTTSNATTTTLATGALAIPATTGVINFGQGDITLINTAADTLTLAGGTFAPNDITPSTGSALRTRTTLGNTFALSARDTGAGAYTVFDLFTAGNPATRVATFTSATTSNIFATTASTSSLFLSTGTCSGSNALNVTNGLVTCGAVSGSGSASTTLLADNNNFSGRNKLATTTISSPFTLLLGTATTSKQSVAGGGPENIGVQRTNANDLFIFSGVTNDVNGRWLVQANGLMGWGAGGTADQDINFYRSGAGALTVQSATTNSTDAFRVNQSSAGTGTAVLTVNTVSAYVAVPWLLVNGASGGAKMDVYGGGTTALRAEQPNASDVGFSAFVTGDTQLRFSFLADGSLKWGTGSVAGDTTLVRSNVGELTVGSGIVSVRSTSTSATSTSFFSTTASTTKFFYGAGSGCAQFDTTGLLTSTGSNCGSGGSGDPYPFKGTGNSTSTLTQFNQGITAYATSTIGNGSVQGGLTISGNATTTGNGFHSGPVACGTSLAMIGGKGMEVCGNDNVITGGVNHILGNSNAGASAFADYLLLNDLADSTVTHYGVLNLNSSGFNSNFYGPGLNVANMLFIQNTDGPLSFAASTTTAPGYINFFTASTSLASERMRIDAGGHIGIGTTTPQWPLQIASSTRPQLVLSDPSTLTNNHWSFRNAGGLLYIATSSPTTFGTSSVSALAIDANGKLTLPSYGGTTGCAQFDTNGQISNVGSACGTGGSGDPYPFKVAGNATSTLTQFNGGLTSFASSTIGNGTTAGGLTINGTATTSLILLGDGTASNPSASFIDDQNNGIFSPSNDIFAIATNGTERMRIDDGSGFTGFGTTTPKWLFDLATSTRPQLALTDSSSVNTNHWTFRNAGGLLYVATSSPSTFATSTVPAFMVDANGNFGIGTTSAPSRLTVGISPSAGSFPAVLIGNNSIGTPSANGTYLGISAPAAFSGDLLRIQGGSSGLGGDVLTVAAGGNMTLANGSFTAGGNVSVGAANFFNFTGRSIITSQADGSIMLQNSAGSDFTRLTLGGTTTAFPGITKISQGLVFGLGDGTNGGFFGIGTSTPKFSLMVASSTRPQIALSDGSLASSPWTLRSAGGVFYVATSSPTTFATSTKTALTIDTNGNVGINDSTPNFGLEIDSQIGGNGFFGLSTTGEGDIFIVDPVGRVGIGTTTPARNLTIASSTKPQLMLTDASLTSAPWNFRSAGGNLYIATSSPTTFATSSVSAVTIDPNGLVGIASSTPWRTLSMNGTGAWTGLTVSTAGTPLCILSNFEIVSPGGSTCALSSQFTKKVLGGITTADADNFVLNSKPIVYKGNDDGVERYGFVAEDMAKLDPRMTDYAKTKFNLDGHTFNIGDPLSIAYDQAVPAIVKYLQDHAGDAAKKAKRSIEENYQWLAIVVLFGIVLWQGRAIKRLKLP